MKPDLRKNPRFLAHDGVPAELLVGEAKWPGRIHNFSATGFAVALGDEADIKVDTALTISFSPGEGKAAINLIATVANRGLMPDGKRRIGCLIGELGDQATAYFTFLTALVGKQGMIKSMERKPVKVAQGDAT